MFKKFVSNLPFTPSLLPQISFYAKRLGQESATRKLGVVFAGLTIILQSVLFITPPQPSLASSNNDVIFGGLSSDPARAKQQLVNHVYRGDKAMVSPYNNKKYYDLDKLFTHFDISAQDIRNAEVVTICSQCNEKDKDKRSVGRLPNSVDASRDVKFKPADSRYSYYLRPLNIWDSGPYSQYKALKIRSGVWVLLNCGNIVVNEVPDANLKITKFQSPPDGRTVTAGSTIKYSFKVKNTGSAAAQNVVIKDLYPSTKLFDSVRVEKGEADAATAKAAIGSRSYSRWVYRKINPGQTVVVRLQARLKAGSSREICNAGTADYENAEGTTRKARSNTVCFNRKSPPPSPSYSCTSLNNTSPLTGIVPYTTNFRTTYQVANGAQFQKQIYYVDGEKAGETTGSNFSYKFDQPGEYRVHTVVVTSAGTTALNESCAKTVTVNPPTASYSCRQLEVLGDVLGTERLVTSFKADYQLANTELQSLHFFIDGELASTQTENTYQHTFTKLGAHTVHVIVVTTDGSTEKSQACSTVVNVEETPDNSIEEDKSARVITGFNPVMADDSDQRSASVDGRKVRAGEMIEYELSIINSGNVSYDDAKPYQPPTESLVDVLEYANVINTDGQVVTAASAYDKPVQLFGGGTLDGGDVTWPEITAFDPGSTIRKSIFVQVKDTIPKTNTPPSDPFSYDCTMSNTYINSSTVNIDVECPPEKVVESAVTSLPNTGPLQTAMVTGGFALLAFYLFSRNQLLIRELEIIQTEYSGGPLR